MDLIWDIEICLNIQNCYNYHRKEFLNNNILSFVKNIQKLIIEKRKILSVQNINSKDFYIIQSDSTCLNDLLYIFPNNKYII